MVSVKIGSFPDRVNNSNDDDDDDDDSNNHGQRL